MFLKVVCNLVAQLVEVGIADAVAQEENEAIDIPEEELELDEGETGGVGPGNLLYGLDRALERIELALTFDKSAKAKKGLEHARERILEAREKMQEKELEKAEKEHLQQNQLQKILFEKGWQIPPCLRSLLWAELGKSNSLETCRFLARFYSFIKAGEAEIWQQLHRLDKHNGINDYQKLKAIVTFAVENPGMFNCSHPLLRHFCPGDKCSIAELMKELENPYLFEQR